MAKSKYYKKKKYYKRKKQPSSNYYMDTIEFPMAIKPVGTGVNDGRYKMHVLQSQEDVVSVSISKILMGDEGAVDLSKIFGYVKVNAISIISNPSYTNKTASLNGFNGDVILVYYASTNNKHDTYHGGIQQGKNCMHLNPFDIGTKYISLRGYTRDYVGLSDLQQAMGNLPGDICIYNSGEVDPQETTRNPVWNVVVKLYCTFKR